MLGRAPLVIASYGSVAGQSQALGSIGWKAETLPVLDEKSKTIFGFVYQRLMRKKIFVLILNMAFFGPVFTRTSFKSPTWSSFNSHTMSFQHHDILVDEKVSGQFRSSAPILAVDHNMPRVNIFSCESICLLFYNPFEFVCMIMWEEII